VIATTSRNSWPNLKKGTIRSSRQRSRLGIPCRSATQAVRWDGRGSASAPMACVASELARWEAAYRPGCRHTGRNSCLRAKSPVGNLHVLREVGRGGMGVAYAREQAPLGCAVAAHQRRPPHFAGCERGAPFHGMQFIEGPYTAEVLARLKEEENYRGERGGTRSDHECSSSAPLRELRGFGCSTAIAALSTMRSIKAE
jgi:hypothetical protein